MLLHGVGSKRNLINDFHNEIIADHPTLIINGFFPSLTLKDVSEPMKLNMCVCVCVCSIIKRIFIKTVIYLLNIISDTR